MISATFKVFWGIESADIEAKSVFPTDDSLFKMLYLAMMDITEKWAGRRQAWSRIHAQLPSILPIVCRINRLQQGKSRVEINRGSRLRP